MTVCRFFQQGCCRFGSACRFEHVYAQNYSNQGQQQQQQQQQQQNQYKVVNNTPNNVTTEQLINQVSSDISVAVNGHQWITSSYGPFKCKPNFPGMLDISAEELRYQMYEARTNGTLPQIEAQIAQHIAEATEKFRTLSKPTGPIVAVIESVYRNEMAKDPFAANSFNFNQNSSNAFGSSNTPVQASNVFGGAIQSSQSSTAAGSLFAEAAQSIFQTPSQNVFGAANSFSTPNPLQVEPVQNNFGAFNAPDFNQQANNNAMQQNSVFGPNVNQPHVNLTNVFGQAQSGISPAMLFASANNAMTTPITSSSNNNVFGQLADLPNANVVPQNVFSTQPTNPFQMQPSDNVFFNSASVNNNNLAPELYSKMDSLTEEELAAFGSDVFLHGQIPENPPPIELCD